MSQIDDNDYGEWTAAPDPAPTSNTGRYAGIGGIITILLILAIGYFGLDGGLLGNGDPADPELITDYFDYDILFTSATCPATADREGGIDEVVAATIDEARQQIDIAAFDLDSKPIIDALIAAEERNLTVRVVVDNEHTPKATIDRLRRNGTSVIEDKRSALMHNKFVIIDGRYLWTGSMNFASTGVYCNNNNLVWLDAPQLADNYTAEMDEMYIDRAFGPTSPRNNDTKLTLGGIPVENYFASEHEVARSIARVVARAEREILFMAFSFTNEDIGEAIIERADDGVFVQGVIEKTGADTAASYLNDFRRAKLDNLEVRKDGNRRLMHHKVMIIDGRITIFGSFNFSNAAADNNDENVIIIDDPTFAQAFIEEFEIVWSEAEIP